MTPVEEPTRAYRSVHRERQAAQTRRRVVTAAARLFASSGYQATTMAAIAREAEVSTETVKAAASKAELLLAAFEVNFSGSEGVDALADTELGQGIYDIADDVFVEAVIQRITTANSRSHALWTVLLGAALSDAVVADALKVILQRRAADYRAFASELTRRGLFGRDIVGDEVDVEAMADVLSFLLSPESYQQLVEQSGWSVDRYRAWLQREVAHVGAPSR
ncbi:TetR/AcrR family transcriptional regulator [uncultured Microbacterium sp.]|uniref:TetR/AcrR family transcriptional regulator n=1 Tax=uncultured Microbacterium sp. TaxID=191216 RepID=UPI0035CB35EB